MISFLYLRICLRFSKYLSNAPIINNFFLKVFSGIFLKLFDASFSLLQHERRNSFVKSRFFLFHFILVSLLYFFFMYQCCEVNERVK